MIHHFGTHEVPLSSRDLRPPPPGCRTQHTIPPRSQELSSVSFEYCTISTSVSKTTWKGGASGIILVLNTEDDFEGRSTRSAPHPSACIIELCYTKSHQEKRIPSTGGKWRLKERQTSSSISTSPECTRPGCPCVVVGTGSETVRLRQISYQCPHSQPCYWLPLAVNLACKYQRTGLAP